MPGLFAVGIVQAANTTFRPGEDLYAFLDDTYITCPAELATHFCRPRNKAWLCSGRL